MRRLKGFNLRLVERRESVAVAVADADADADADVDM